MMSFYEERRIERETAINAVTAIAKRIPWLNHPGFKWGTNEGYQTGKFGIMLL